MNPQHRVLCLYSSLLLNPWSNHAVIQNTCNGPCFRVCTLFQVVSDAAGQGVTISGTKTFNNWNWPNAVIFAATVITTIGEYLIRFDSDSPCTHINTQRLTSGYGCVKGYGNIAPKTSAGRAFCIFYGLFGVPLCLTWISELGKFFGGRAKHLGLYLTKKGFSLVSRYLVCANSQPSFMASNPNPYVFFLFVCFPFSRGRLNLPVLPFSSCGVCLSI